MLLRPSDESEPLEAYFKPSLEHLAVGASSQARGGRKVEVGKGDIGDCESRSIGCLYPTSLGITSIDGSVRNDQRVLKDRVYTECIQTMYLESL